MKNVTRLYALLATALMIAAATTSFAQQGGGRGPGGGGQGGPQQGGPGGGGMRQRNQMGGTMYIIKMSTVQAHLNLTAEQKAAVAALRPPQGGPGGGGQGGPGGGGQGGPGGGGQGGPGQGGPGQGGPGGEGDRPDPLAEILNENQLNRLKQLALQFDAPMSLMDKKVAQLLALTESQRTELDTIIKNAFPRPQGGPGGGQGGPQGGGNGGNPPTPPTFAEMLAKKATATTAAMGVLTATQKEKWGTMTGAKFTNWVEVPRPNN